MPGVARDTHDCDSVCKEEVSRCLLKGKDGAGGVCCGCRGVLCFEGLKDEESVERRGGNSSR